MSAPARNNVVHLPVTSPRTAREILETSYREDFDVVWRVLARYGVHPNELEDAPQTLVIRLHDALESGRFDKARSPRAWLIGAAWFLASELRKHSSKKYEEYDGEQPRDHRDPRSADREAQMGDDDRVRRALGVLTEDERELVVRFYIEEYTAADIAEHTGTGENTLYSRLRLAKRKFVDEFTRLAMQGAR